MGLSFAWANSYLNTCKVPPNFEQTACPPHPLWIPPKSIRLIDKQADLRHNHLHNLTVGRGLAKAARHSLLVEYWIRAEETATSIETCLGPAEGETDPTGVYAVLKRWYQHASARAPKPSRAYMEKVKGDFHTLYQLEYIHTPGLPLATHMEPVQVNDATPSEVEVEAAVRHLRPLKADGHTHLCT